MAATIESLAALVPADALTGDLKRRVDRALQFKVIRCVDVDVQDDPSASGQDAADDQYGLRDFSPPTIERRRARGYALAKTQLASFL